MIDAGHRRKREIPRTRDMHHPEGFTAYACPTCGAIAGSLDGEAPVGVAQGQFEFRSIGFGKTAVFEVNVPERVTDSREGPGYRTAGSDLLDEIRVMPISELLHPFAFALDAGSRLGEGRLEGIRDTRVQDSGCLACEYVPLVVDAQHCHRSDRLNSRDIYDEVPVPPSCCQFFPCCHDGGTAVNSLESRNHKASIRGPVKDV